MAKQSRGSIVDTAGATAVTADRRHQMIATAAYYRAERRAFRGGDALADWLDAEAEIDHMLKAAARVRKTRASYRETSNPGKARDATAGI